MDGQDPATLTTPSLDRGDDPRVRASPRLRERRPAGYRRRAREVRQDALLFLRSAVRHAAQGQGQPRRWRGALVRIPVQQGDDVSEGHQALPAAVTSGSAAPRLREGSRLAGRLPDAGVRRRDPSDRCRDRSNTTCIRERRVRAPLWRQPDHREDVPDGQVCPHVSAHREHRLQRPALHGQRRCGQQEGVRHRSRGQPLERHPWRGRDPGQRRQHRRMRAHHHELCLAGPRAGRQGHRRGSAHHTDRADLRPVPAGQAGTRHGALQRHPAPDDRARLARSSRLSRTTRSGSTPSRRTCANGRHGERRRSPASR